MKKFAIFAASGLVVSGCALIAVPASAQDTDGTFTGPRVEALLGYDISKAGSTIDDDTNPNNDQSVDGLLYGAGIGYDVGLGGVVVGAEAELTGSTAKSKGTAFDPENFGLGRVKTNRDIYVGARVGARLGPQMLLYAKGGYTNAKFDVTGSDGAGMVKRDIDADGWRVGAGAEYALSRHAYAKLEYRYSNYSKAEVDFGGDIPDSSRFGIDTDRHQVVAGVGWRF